MDSIGISNSDIDDIADNEGYSAGSLPQSDDIYITGGIIPNTDNSVDIGASSKNIKMVYTKGITINGTQFLPSDYVTLNGAQTIPGDKTFSGLTQTNGKLPYSYSGNDLNNAIYNMETTSWGSTTANRPSTSDYGTLLSLNREGNVHTSEGGGWIAQLGIGTNLRLYLRTKTNTNGAWENWKEFITANDAIPRSGGAVLSGSSFSRTVNNSELSLEGGTAWNTGARIVLYGNIANGAGSLALVPGDGTNYHIMSMKPDGTWTWDGTACQITSDQRYKQQISNIDDKLLDAWKDVEPVQFKYNDAVTQKGDNARLHTGYVVQQIDEACQEHNIDISEYGLFCHEEYPEETEEVEVEQKDGTKKTERKVIREANEHYSLRYTETLVVECAYLRKRIKALEERLEKLEGNSK